MSCIWTSWNQKLERVEKGNHSQTIILWYLFGSTLADSEVNSGYLASDLSLLWNTFTAYV